MPLSLDDFIKQVKEEVDFLFESYSYVKESKDWAFAQWILELLFPSIDSDQAFNILIFDETWNVNAYYRDDASGVFYLLHTRYSEDPKEVKFGPGVVYGILDVYRKITNEPMSMLNTPLAEAVQAIEDDYTISLVLALFGDLDNSIDLPNLEKKYELDEQQFRTFNIHRLRQIYAGLEEEVSAASITLNFSSYADYSEPVEALVGNVSGYELKKAIGNLVPQIYASNLRAPLGSTKVNQQMRETLSSTEQRKFFWYYNNGITMLCKGFQHGSNDINSFTVDSPRIVNGAQTVDTILSTPISESDQVGVMVRVIAALPGSEQVSNDMIGQSGLLEDLYLNIARYTNSQNAIEMPDFRSNEKVQRQLHEKFKELGWFYEHRRGQWEGVSNKSEYLGRKIKMVDLAQQWFAFDGQPSIAIREKRSLFEEQGHYGNIFMLSRSAEEYLLAHLLFKQIQDRLKAKISTAKEKARVAEASGRVPLSAQNYLMIGRATKLAIAHMAALLGKALKDRYGSLNRDLAKQILSVVTNEKLIEKVYPELEDTLFRLATQLQGEKYKSLHRMLSETETFDELYDLFQYVLEREENKGRDILAID